MTTYHKLQSACTQKRSQMTELYLGGADLRLLHKWCQKLGP